MTIRVLYEVISTVKDGKVLSLQSKSHVLWC